MKLFYAFILLLVTLAVMGTVSADQTLKTINIPLGFNASITEDMREYYSVNINFPDGIEEIHSLVIEVQGDVIANTNIRAGKRKGAGSPMNCDPVPWVVSTAQNNHRSYFDCTDLIMLDNWKGYDIDFFVRPTENVTNARVSMSLTYLNKPKADVQLKGTEYNPADNATTFLQLIDSLGSYVNNATCDLTVYYPTQLGTNSSKFLDSVPMSFVERGLYEFNYAAPTTFGVYKVSAICQFEDIGQTFNLPFNTSFDGNLFDQSLGDRSEVEFSDCVFMKTEASTFQEFDFFDAGIGNLNASTLDAILGVWIGQNDKVLTMQIFNFTSSTWDNFPGSTIGISTGSGGTCGHSHGASRLVTEGFVHYIGGVGNDEILLRVLGSQGKILTDDVELRVRITEEAVDDIRGAGEVHIRPFPTNNTEIAEDVWNFTGTINPSLLTQLASAIWSFTGTIVDNIKNQTNSAVWNTNYTDVDAGKFIWGIAPGN